MVYIRKPVERSENIIDLRPTGDPSVGRARNRAARGYRDDIADDRDRRLGLQKVKAKALEEAARRRV